MRTEDGSHVWLPKDIVDKLRTDFPNEPLGTLQALLREYRGKEQARVFRCIVQLSQGDMQRLLHFIAVANEDYRNLICCAEYDREGQRIRDFSQPFYAQQSVPTDAPASRGRG